MSTIVYKRISNADLGSIESFGLSLSVGYLNRKHFVCFGQSQPPPGVQIHERVTAGTVSQIRGPTPIIGLICIGSLIH